MNLRRGLRPEKRLTTSCTFLVELDSFSHCRISSGRCVPVGPALLVADLSSSCPPLERRKASRSVTTPFHGSAHCRSSVSTSLGLTLIPKVVSVAEPGLKSMQCEPLKPPSLATASGQPSESRKEGASQEPISRPPESRRLSLPAALK